MRRVACLRGVTPLSELRSRGWKDVTQNVTQIERQDHQLGEK